MKKKIFAKGPEVWHVGFVSPEVFFRWVALRFQEITFAKTDTQVAFRSLFVEQETGRLFIVYEVKIKSYSI